MWWGYGRKSIEKQALRLTSSDDWCYAAAICIGRAVFVSVNSWRGCQTEILASGGGALALGIIVWVSVASVPVSTSLEKLRSEVLEKVSKSGKILSRLNSSVRRGLANG